MLLITIHSTTLYTHKFAYKVRGKISVP